MVTVSDRLTSDLNGTMSTGRSHFCRNSYRIVPASGKVLRFFERRNPTGLCALYASDVTSLEIKHEKRGPRYSLPGHAVSRGSSPFFTTMIYLNDIKLNFLSGELYYIRIPIILYIRRQFNRMHMHTK